MKSRNKIVVAVATVLLFIMSVTIIVPRVGNIHQLNVNSDYLNVRQNAIENNTSEYNFVMMHYFSKNISISGFGSFEIAAVPCYAPHPNLTLNESNTSVVFAVPSVEFFLVLLHANYTSFGSLWFRPASMNVSSANNSLDMGQPPFLIIGSNESFLYHIQIGTGYYVEETSSIGFNNYINDTSLPDGTYYLTFKFNLYRNVIGIPIPEGQYSIQFPFVTIIGTAAS